MKIAIMGGGYVGLVVVIDGRNSWEKSEIKKFGFNFEWIGR